jgi:hypothetical protein
MHSLSKVEGLRKTDQELDERIQSLTTSIQDTN